MTSPSPDFAAVFQHEVLNQPEPLPEYDAVADDPVLAEGLAAFGVEQPASLKSIGRAAGSKQAREWGRLADTYTPVLHTHDRYGNRLDEVEFHPAWHHLMGTAVSNGLHAAPWRSARQGAHVERAVGFMAWYQVEAGHGCPISMTYAAVPALQVDPELAARYVPGLASTSYDFGLRPPADKSGLIAGMAMTEKQGGSDVRANTTRAYPDPDSGWFRLLGHKFFCSAPMSDLFLVLAQDGEEGLSCFVVPRVLPDGTRNPFAIQRLKDKLGNRSNASSEIEFTGTWAQRLGEPGRGVRTIVEMVSATRLDCVLGSAALMRRALTEAGWHAARRSAFGRPLLAQPLMRTVLTDLAVEVEAAQWLGLRLAAAVDAGEDDFRRIALPMGKYYVCKRAPGQIFEAMEALGGSGYVEDSGLPRLYREAPVNSIWEGSGSINALDLLRAMAREPGSVDAWLTEIADVRGSDPAVDAALLGVLDSLALDPAALEPRARWLAEQMVTLLQTSLLQRYAPPAVAEAFVARRFGRTPATVGATLASGDDEVLARSLIVT
ncbi:MAG: DNA alkylation response protein [Actinobacteria bacterium]|nr:MAG: DNA alkylation response protein [Actinomycetota bacterium]